jgi:hypothetical protein
MAAGSTYTPIATQTLGSSTSTVTFSSIPSTYTDLVLVMQSGTTPSNDDIGMRFNNDSGTNYSSTAVNGSSGVYSDRSSNASSIQIDYRAFDTTNLNRISSINIQNYSNTTTYKTSIIRNSNASIGVEATVGLWRSTSAITRVDLYGIGGNSFATGSTFTLYGIASA